MHADKSRLSIGQVIAHMFEKAINVQYNDFLGKLSKPQTEFFFCGSEDHLYSRDMHIAKFWMNLAASEQDLFWQKIEEKKTEIVEAVKDSEVFKQAQSCQEPIKEETEDAQSDSAASDAEYPFNKLKARGIGMTGHLKEADSNDTSSEDGQSTAWRSGPTQKMRAHKLKKKNYFVSGNADESDDEASKYGVPSNASSSNGDDENHRSSQRNWNLGYRPLPDKPESDEEKSSGPRRE